MNKENASKLWKIIQEAGDYLGEQRDNTFHIKLHYSKVLMRILKSQLEINGSKTHQFKQKTRNESRNTRDVSRFYVV